MITNQDPNSSFFLCECGCSILHMRRWEKEKEIFVSIYGIGQYRPKPTIMERLKYCWKHLITGKIYEDEIILDHQSTKNLKDWLDDQINRIENIDKIEDE